VTPPGRARRAGILPTKPAAIAVECGPNVTPGWGAVNRAPSVGASRGGRPGPFSGGDAGGGLSGGSSGVDASLGSLPGYCPHRGKHARLGEVAPPIERLGSSFELRARLRRHAVSPRIAKCGRVVHTDPSVVTEVYASGERRARWTGLVTCQRAGCPVCEAARARKLGRAVRRVVAAGGTWTHVALTVPHAAADRWSAVFDRLLSGLRGLSHGAAGRILRSLVDATVRATESTWGERHGWHVHFHVLWNVRRPLTDGERETIARAWSDLTGASLEHGCRFGRTYVAREHDQAAEYVDKLAREIEGSSKHAHSEHWTLGELFWRAARGERVDLLQDYQTETRGRRLYQLDRRARRMHDAAPELPETRVVERWITPLERHTFSDLSRAEWRDPSAVYLPLEVAITMTGDPSDAIEEAVFELVWADQREQARGHPRKATGPP
jgi:hypothetical protein